MKNYYFHFLTLCLTINPVVDAQVGMGTKLPSLGTVLHIDDNSGTKGVLLPTASIPDLNVLDPLPPGTQEGTMVYNIDSFTGQGHFYWNGFVWAPIQVFGKRSAKFIHAKPTEMNVAVNLNKSSSTGGVDVELMDNTVFNQSTALFTPVNDVNNRATSLQVHQDGRYRITVYLGIEQDSNFSGSTAIQGRLKITNTSDVIRYEGSHHRSTEMDQTGTGDDDGTLYFTEVIELFAGERVALNCSYAQGTAPVYHRDPNISALIIEKLR